MRRGVLALALGLLAVPAGAGDWQVAVLPEGCAATQSVLGRASGAVLLRAILIARPGGAELFLQVPTGADLAQGIAYRHGGDPGAVGLDWTSCDPDLCTAHVSLDPQRLDRLRRGASVEVGFRPLPDSPLLNLPLSLRGLTAALGRTQDCPGKESG